MDRIEVNYTVYVLKSESHVKFYTGMTNNLERRLHEHNKGLNKSTKAFIPWKVVYTEEYKDRKVAREREKFLKSGDGRTYVRSLL